MDKRRILFVDDEPNVLQALRRMLHGMRQVWEMVFVTDPRRGLELLDQEHFDVVISDMRMPVMDGGQFLSEVMRHHPHIVRIVLSGHADRESTMEVLSVTHQLLAKPCDPNTLKATVGRTLALRKLLDGDTPLKALVSRLETLPSLPSLYAKIVLELQCAEATVASVAAIIAEDPAMTAKILQLVNSAYFGLRRQISSLSQAVGLLGLDTIKALVLTAQVFSQYDPELIQVLSVEALWQHSTQVGALARRIVELEGGCEETANDALMAGLLHDLGKLILAANLPNIYAKIQPLMQRENLGRVEAEIRLFGATHGETGAYLLGLWGLPESIVEAVAYHHYPRHCTSRHRLVVVAVHVANDLSHEFTPDLQWSRAAPLDREYLEDVGLDRRLPVWRSTCQLPLVT